MYNHNNQRQIQNNTFSQSNITPELYQDKHTQVDIHIYIFILRTYIYIYTYIIDNHVKSIFKIK